MHTKSDKPFSMVIFKIFWCIPIFFYYSICVAQQNRTDSLKKIIATAKDDTNKVNTLIDLSQNYLNTDTKTALIYAMQAKDLAEKLNFQNGKGWALKKIGQVYNIQSDYVNALQAWKEALKIFEVSGNKLGTSNMLNNIGVIYYNKSMEDSKIKAPIDGTITKVNNEVGELTMQGSAVISMLGDDNFEIEVLSFIV